MPRSDHVPRVSAVIDDTFGGPENVLSLRQSIELAFPNRVDFIRARLDAACQGKLGDEVSCLLNYTVCHRTRGSSVPPDVTCDAEGSFK